MKTHKHKASRKYAAIEKGAAMRGIEFDITFSEYEKGYYQKPCHYCGITAIGLDRICSVEGYSIGNAVSCCATCNMMKGVLERDAFLTHCKRIALLHDADHCYSQSVSQLPLPKSKILEVNRGLILQALKDNEYNRAETAKSLGISTTTLWRKIKHFNLTNAK